MFVSIITPCYNSSPYIGETIKSVISQTYTNWEMIIVDDCSTDNSAEIIKEYAKTEKRIIYLRTEKPSGSPTRPRNIAIKNAKGRFIAFLDSDDIWLPDKLQNQINLFKCYNDIAIAFSYYEKINEEGQRNGRIVTSPSIVSYESLLYGNVIGNLTGMYDTSKVGKIYLDYVGHEDYVLWLSILKKGYIARSTKSVDALYRVRYESISSNKLKVLKWTWNIYTKNEKLGFIKSAYYFSFYAIKALLKKIK